MTPDLRLVMDHTLRHAVDRDAGIEYHVRTYADGAETVQWRYIGERWSQEMDMLPVGGAS